METITLINSILQQSKEESAAALALVQGFNAFARGYEMRNTALLELVRKLNSETGEAQVSSSEVKTTGFANSVILETAPEPKTEETAPIKPEEKVPAKKEEVVDKKPAAKKTDAKLPTKAELARAVSGIFVNLQKLGTEYATTELDALFTQYDAETLDDIAGKPESVQFLAEVKWIRESALTFMPDVLGEAAEEITASVKIEKPNEVKPVIAKIMLLEEFRAEVEIFAKSTDQSKVDALLAAKEKFQVAKASAVAPEDYAAFVAFMKESAETQDDEF